MKVGLMCSYILSSMNGYEGERIGGGGRQPNGWDIHSGAVVVQDIVTEVVEIRKGNTCILVFQ